MEKKALTRRQIEALEDFYHGRYGLRQRSGGSVMRMVERLERRGYVVEQREYPYRYLTSAGYHALSQDKKAMAHIDPAELSERMKTAARAERDAEQARIAEQEQRAKARAAAEAQSRKDRLAKLREIAGEGFGDDDDLLAFAEQVRSIMEVY